MINLTINRQSIDVEEGLTVLQAAERLGISIPTLCYHRDLSPFGGCRLCVVEVQGARLPMTSCILPVSPGLVVQTESPALTRYRRAILRLLLKNFYDAGYKRNGGGAGLDLDSEFARLLQLHEVDLPGSMAKKPAVPVDSDPNPFVWVDMNKCIQCTRCVRACGEIQGRFVWSQSFRGYQARIVAGADTTMLQARCESCGACVAYCPTGALDNKMAVTAGRADLLVNTTCAYCGVGCQLDLNIKNDVPGGRVIRVTSSETPAPESFNGMHLCIKGRYGYDFIHSPRRITRPRLRQYLLDGTHKPPAGQRGRWVEVDWETALEITARRLGAIRQEHGGQAVGILASGKLTNEENYLLNKLARQALGTNNIDTCAHLYSAGVAAGLEQSFHIPAGNTTFDQVAGQARSLLVIGSNLTEQHPVLGARIRQAILRRKVKMVVAYPDFTNIAEYAALRLYPHSHTETALINGLMHIILKNGWADAAVLEQSAPALTEFKAVIERCTPQVTAEICGVSIEDLAQAAGILALNRPMAVLWGPGLAHPEHGPGNVQSLVNLQLLLGNLELPGGGLLPLRLQNNSQGASDMGAHPAYLPGYLKIADDSARSTFEQAWGVAPPPEGGLNARQILEAVGQEEIQALYILGEEILNTTPAGAAVRRSLERCSFIVLQEIQSSETDRYADVILPGASFAEKSGTFTSAERRIQLVRQAIEPVGQARPDWQIISALAQRILAEDGVTLLPGRYSGWEYSSSEQVLEEIAALNPLYEAITLDRLTKGERLHWQAPVFDASQAWRAVEQPELHAAPVATR